MRKQWLFADTNFEQVLALKEQLGIHPALCKLLVQRGILHPAAAQQFFQPSADQYHSPFLLKDMEKAVRRLDQAIENQERILLYGDYDVDGTSAVALLHTFLAPHHDALDYYLPDRYQEGYGLSTQGVEYARTSGARLLLTLDCGIKAQAPIALANRYGIDVIICDHHLPATQLPGAIAILNPKQNDCSYPFPELCGTAIAYKFAQAYALSQGLAERETEQLLGLVAIATTCDIMPLRGENRVLTYWGLQQLESTQLVGIQALLQRSGRQPPFSVSDIVFDIGPIINAAGRLGHAREAVQLLLEKDPLAAEQQASSLEQRNALRKEYDRTMVDEANQLLAQAAEAAERKSIVLYQPHWHKGVVGIAAARMVDAHHKPSIMLTRSEEQIVGSARSVPGFDIHAAISQCQDLLLHFGGHRYAAGLSLPLENLEAFRQRFEEVVSREIKPLDLQASISITAELQLSSISPLFWEQLKRFAPFGPANRRPVFVSRGVVDTGQSRVLKNKHLKLQIAQDASAPMSAIAFGFGHLWEEIREQPFDICYTIEENTWKGKTTLQLNVKDIQVHI